MKNAYLPDAAYLELHGAMVSALMAHLDAEQAAYIRSEDRVTLEQFETEADERLCAAGIVPEELREDEAA